MYFKKGDLVRLTSAAYLSDTKDEENRHLDVNRFDTEDLELATITTAKQLKRQFYFWGKT